MSRVMCSRWHAGDFTVYKVSLGLVLQFLGMVSQFLGMWTLFIWQWLQCDCKANRVTDMLCCIFFSVETVAMHGKSTSLRICLVGDVVPKAFGSTLVWVVSCRLSRCSHSSV